MTAALQTPPAASTRPAGRPFDLADDADYRRWRDWKLQHRPADAAAVIVDVADPRSLGAAERQALLDHELVFIALRDESPALVRALMRADAMTIPAREDDDGVARPAQGGPVFSVDDGALHMRYTARTRSIEWHADADVQQAVARLAALLESGLPGQLQLRLEAGMGLVGHNVLHDRSAFVDDPARPRLLYRARFLDRVSTG